MLEHFLKKWIQFKYLRSFCSWFDFCWWFVWLFVCHKNSPGKWYNRSRSNPQCFSFGITDHRWFGMYFTLSSWQIIPNLIQIINYICSLSTVYVQSRQYKWSTCLQFRPFPVQKSTKDRIEKLKFECYMCERYMYALKLSVTHETKAKQYNINRYLSDRGKKIYLFVSSLPRTATNEWLWNNLCI